MKSDITLSIAYACLASFIVGFHIFSFKYIDIINKMPKSYKKSQLMFWTILISAIAFILSRIFIFKGMEKTTHPAYVHLILNCSVFITLVLSVIILNQSLDYLRLIGGIIITLVGLAIVQTSIKN